jgi:hypothetical protein
MLGKLPVEGGSFISDFGQVIKTTDVVERLRRDLRFNHNDLKLLGKQAE